MSFERMIGAASAAAMLLLAAIFLPQMVAADSFLFRELLTPRVVILIVAPLKLLFLVVATVYAARSAGSFGEANPVRSAWWLLATGLACYVVAQSVLAFYQVFLDDRAPFPSIADVFFVPATCLMAVSLFAFLVTYKRSGLEIAGRSEVAAVAIGASALLLVFYIVVGRPVLASGAPLAEQALNIAYPVLDCILLVPVVLLLRMALSMRGGSLWKVWMTLLVGFGFMAAGDILFAFFTSLEQAFLDPLLDLAFAWSYVLIGRATTTQYGILASSSP